MFHLPPEPDDFNCQPRLFAALTNDTFFGRFTRMALAAGEFVESGQRASGAAAPDQVTAVVRDKGDGDWGDVVHWDR